MPAESVGQAGNERTVVDHGSEVTTVVEDHVGLAAVGKSGERLLNAPEVLLLGLALPGEDGDTAAEGPIFRHGFNDSHGRQTYVTAMLFGEKSQVSSSSCDSAGGSSTHAAAAWSWVEKMLQPVSKDSQQGTRMELQSRSVFTRPGDLGTESGEGLDEDGSLNGPVDVRAPS